MTDRRPTHRERVEQRFCCGEGIVCATWFLNQHMPAARSRIAEMRKEGWAIVSETCQNPYHSHDTHQIQYRHVAGPNCSCPQCKDEWPRW